MNLQTIIRTSVLACALMVLSVTPSWAVPVNLIIQNGGFPGFNATFLHQNHLAGGAIFPEFQPLNGKLKADLNTTSGIKLSNIMGVMTGDTGYSITITDGMIQTNTGSNPSGFFDYSIIDPTDALNGRALTGTLTFLSTETSNLLNMSFVQLWGGDLHHYDKGMDFRANLQPVPEPSTMILFGSGLVGLIGWRNRKP